MDKSKVIGSGGYGCVALPPLPCKKSKIKTVQKATRTSKLVGKIMQKDDAEIELKMSELLKAIPGYERYYVIEEKDSCTTTNFARFRKAYEEQCQPFRKAADSQLAQLLAPYAGRSLRQMILRDTFDFSGALEHVLEGVAKLNAQGICHFDIKEDNLLVDVYGTFRLIDFGISFRGDQVTQQVVRDHQFPFAPEYPSDPPELALQRATYKNIDMNYAIQQIFQKKSSIERAALLLGLSKREQEENIRQFWLSEKSVAEEDWVSFYQKFWRKWDAWAVGVVFLSVLKKMLLLPGFITKTWIRDSARIRPVLKGLMMANPNDRLTCEQALRMLRKMSGGGCEGDESF